MARLPGGALACATLLGSGIAMLACAGAFSSHPNPSDYGVDLDISVDELFQTAGYPPSKMANRQREADMIETLNNWYGKDKEKRRFFAVSTYCIDWEILRSRGNPTARTLCGAFFWQDEAGLCHVNGHDLKQVYDGNEYSETFRYHEEAFLPTDAPNRRYLDPLNEFEARSSETTTAIYRGPGLLIEACSDPDAYKAFMAEAQAKADAAPKKKPVKKKVKKAEPKSLRERMRR